MDYHSVLDSIYFGNSVQSYLTSVLFLLVGWMFHAPLASIAVRFINQIFKKSENRLSHEELKGYLKKPLNFFLVIVFLFIASSFLKFPEEWDLVPVSEFGLRRILKRGFMALFIISIIRVALKLVVVSGEVLKKKAEKTSSKQDDQLIVFGVEIVKIVVIVFAILLILSSVFKLNVGALVAGLGIGGLAIALAAKESLENLLGSFTIFFDKPFTVGDMVRVGGVEGTVEKVGFRSTRIRTPEKSYLTIPNRNMISAELDNMSLRTFRRVKFNVGLLYGTSSNVMKDVVRDIQKYIDAHEHTNQDGQVKFMDFGPSSLDIMVLYYIDTMDYALFLKIKEEINYKIMEIVEGNGADFAFPTQTIHLQNQKVE